MNKELYKEVREDLECWARQRGIPEGFLRALEVDAHWAFCSSNGDGISEDLAPQLFEDVLEPFGLGAREAVELAHIFSFHAERWEPENLEKLDALEEMEKVLQSWNERLKLTLDRFMKINRMSTASYRPRIVMPGAEPPLKPLVDDLVEAARRYLDYQALVFLDPAGQEISVVEVRGKE